MALGDFPQVPEELVGRIVTLTDQYKSDNLSVERIRDSIISSMGRTRIDERGITLFGDFGDMVFDQDDFTAMAESLMNLVDFAFIINGKEFLIKRGDTIEKVKIGPIVKRSEIYSVSSRHESLPMVEYDPDENGHYPENVLEMAEKVIFHFLDSYTGLTNGKGEPGFSIHRMEEFAGWLENWQDFSKGLDILIPLLELTVKKKIMKTGEAALSLADDILTRCGV